MGGGGGTIQMGGPCSWLHSRHNGRILPGEYVFGPITHWKVTWILMSFFLPADTWYLPVSSRISVELLPTFTVTIYLGQSGKSLVHKSSFWIRRTLSSCLLPLSICKPHKRIICTSITLLLIGPLHESIFIYRRKYDCSVISQQQDKVKTTFMKIHAKKYD